MWAEVLFATLVPVAVVILGGIGHVVLRLGRAEARIKGVEDRQDDMATDVRWLVRRSGGQPAAERSRD